MQTGRLLGYKIKTPPDLRRAKEERGLKLNLKSEDCGTSSVGQEPLVLLRRNIPLMSNGYYVPVLALIRIISRLHEHH